MARSAALDKYHTDSSIDCSTRETGERALLRSILGRAIYDLTPEAAIEVRRDAIQWFREEHKAILLDADLTTWQNIKTELSLSAHSLRLIAEVLRDAESFEVYRLQQQRDKQEVNISDWVNSRNSYLELNPKRGGGPARVRGRKASFAPRVNA